MVRVKINTQSSGSDTSATDHRPMRTATRTSRLSRPLSACLPWICAITGDTAMGMPLPKSQVMK